MTNRRCFCPSRIFSVCSRGTKAQSSQGLISASGPGSRVLWKTRTEAIRWVQVVPTLAGVEITMSPGRGR
ncbi:hypothetical protein V1L54_14270 [Streptomyces sp. TRM 70361]|nr:hypothetical protein [Streptomyces sp. TRM 70361]MEE1940558.1 hypothetical protein [Streptomyces sp. TRM 70361]